MNQGSFQASDTGKQPNQQSRYGSLNLPDSFFLSDLPKRTYQATIKKAEQLLSSFSASFGTLASDELIYSLRDAIDKASLDLLDKHRRQYSEDIEHYSGEDKQ